jgi:hypothetical protein
VLKAAFFSSIFIFIANLQRNEGLELLAPFFRKHPQAFAGLAGALKQLYLVQRGLIKAMNTSG